MYIINNRRDFNRRKNRIWLPKSSYIFIFDGQDQFILFPSKVKFVWTKRQYRLLGCRGVCRSCVGWRLRLVYLTARLAAGNVEQGAISSGFGRRRLNRVALLAACEQSKAEQYAIVRMIFFLRWLGLAKIGPCGTQLAPQAITDETRVPTQAGFSETVGHSPKSTVCYRSSRRHA